MTARLILHLMTKSHARTYVINGENVTKSEFIKFVKDNNLKEVKDTTTPTFGRYVIFNYIQTTSK